MNIWWFRRIIKWLINVLEEYGIKANIVDESYTSRMCSICGGIHEDGRVHRGLYVCRRANKAINADINASLNIARKNGYRITLKYKIISHHVTSSGILNPHQRANTQDPQYRNPIL